MTETRNLYELTYIINAVLNDDQIKNVVARVKEIIEKNGGEVVDTDEWGSRRLAYPIEKKRNGYYVNLYANLIGPSIPRIERSMEIDDDILRYLTLRMDAKMIRHYERTRKAKADAAAAESTDA
ncbi:MAG: 30S ribosomal protein S6 [Bacteroidota bacterium]